MSLVDIFLYVYLRIFTAILRFLTKAFLSVKGARAPVPTGVTRTTIQVPSRDRGRTITVQLYEKDEAAKGERVPHPVHINAHGSGYILPTFGQDVEFCSHVALKTQSVVLDVNYRKAPEYPFPAAHNDIQDVIAYVRSQPASFTSDISLSGFSAGANIVSGIAVNTEPTVIKTLISIYGNMDFTKSYEAPATEYDSGVPVTPGMRHFFYECLLRGHDESIRQDTRLSPYLASVDRWPNNVMIACGEADSLWETGKLTADKVKTGGRNVLWLSIPRESHSFDKDTINAASEERKWDMYDRAVDMISRAITSP